jgi:hypothetical protein
LCIRHLFTVSVLDRQGFCPINGVLLVLPITAADSRGRLDELAQACWRDLTAVFEEFQMRCPVLALICGLEELPGFCDLTERLTPQQVKKGIGQRFPLVHELPADQVPGMVEAAIESVADSLIPSMVHAMFQVESPGGEAPEEVLRVNVQLFRFLTEIFDKREHLARLVRDCLPSLPGEPLMFGGCYFAGTGRDLGEQAFAPGVLARLVKQDQDSVTWTEEALRDNTATLRLARILRFVFILIIGLGVLATAGLIAQRWVFKPEVQGAVAGQGR